MMGRGITWRHKQFAFHRPSAVTISQTIADAPNNAFQILLFCIIVYFMGGFVYTAGAFFSFYIIVLSTYFALAGFFRLLGTLCANYDQASRLASVIITLMITYSGYLIPVGGIALILHSNHDLTDLSSRTDLFAKEMVVLDQLH